MIMVQFRNAILLVVLIVMPKIRGYEINVDSEMGPYREEELPESLPYVGNEKYIRHIHSMINAYRDDMLDGRMVIETNALIDTKYKTWKRNADLINSLLALPKGMNDAGR